MPEGNTCCNPDWLSFKYWNDVLISFWCRKKDTFTSRHLLVQRKQ